MKLVSWNVNSLRNCEDKFLQFMEEYHPDVVMIQELRGFQHDLSFFLQLIDGYEVLFNPAEKAGYAGTALYWKKELPLQVTHTTGNEILDSEGRTIVATMGDMVLINWYTPNGGSPERLAFKYTFYKAAHDYIAKLLADGKHVIVGGDLNVAHTPLDTFDPSITNRSGFLFEERKWMDDLIALGMSDTFRLFEKEKGHYSWWHMRDPQREQNKGLRFDYFFSSPEMTKKVIDAKILREVFGSDHCPVLVEVDLAY